MSDPNVFLPLMHAALYLVLGMVIGGLYLWLGNLWYAYRIQKKNLRLVKAMEDLDKATAETRREAENLISERRYAHGQSSIHIQTHVHKQEGAR